MQVVYARAYTYEQQFEYLTPLAAKMSEEPFKLLIMDSITANMRTEFTGRGELAERQQKLGQLMARLRKVCAGKLDLCPGLCPGPRADPQLS